MSNRRIGSALALISLAVAGQSSAASLALGDLPADIAAALAAGAIQMSVTGGRIESAHDGRGVSAYSYSRDGEARVLLQYEVVPGSTWQTNSGGATDLSGSVFVDVAESYDLSSDGHEIGIFFDQLMPDGLANFLFHSGLPSTTILLDTSALLAGTANYSLSGDPDYIQTGNMEFASFEDHPFICIECAFDLEFNLIFLDFTNGVLNFDPSDTRQVLLNGIDSIGGYEPYGFGLNLRVQNIPVPGAGILLISALLGLVGARRRLLA